jgi:ubiquinone/menaquinone biosynthesis C-methylase UbiE
LQRYTNSNLRFIEQDISQRLAFDDDSFDVVYARLSLHYFKDATTRAIFNEIKRVLVPSGRLYFMCKSIDDSLYGKGEEVEPDMFELEGHVRHFFSPDYCVSLLKNAGFDGENIETGEELIYSRRSAFIKVAAKKEDNI